MFVYGNFHTFSHIRSPFKRNLIPMIDRSIDQSIKSFVCLVQSNSVLGGAYARCPPAALCRRIVVVIKMEFLLGNPYSTPVGQCIGELPAYNRFFFNRMYFYNS